MRAGLNMPVLLATADVPEGGQGRVALRGGGGGGGGAQAQGQGCVEEEDVHAAHAASCRPALRVPAEPLLTRGLAADGAAHGDR